MITMRQLEALQAVIDHQTVTEAAHAMHLSQPALSKLISNLEYRTGLTLFHRVKRRLIPTDEAHILREKANTLFSGLHELDRIAGELRNLSAGRMQIVCLFALGRHFMPRTLARFLTGRAEAEVGFHLHSSRTVNAWMINQQADLGLSMIALDHPAVESRRLCRVPAVCVLPPGHPLCDRAVLHAGDLQDQPFISFSADAQIRRSIDREFDALGVSRELHLVAYMSESACALVANGLGVALADPFTAHAFVERGEVVVRPFQPAIHYEFFLLRPRNRPPSLLTQAFAESIDSEMARYLTEVSV